MNRKVFVLVAGCLALRFMAANAWAALSTQEIARLGKDLTPLGGEMAGNESGTIPPWEGGVTIPPPGYKPGSYRPDPFAEDEPLYVISSKNMAQYADQLTEGHKGLLRTYDSFTMNVYPTRRSAAAPKYIYDATKQIAGKTELASDGNGLKGAVQGIPFPVPNNAYEVMWNFIARYRGPAVDVKTVYAPVTRAGSYTMNVLREQYDNIYHQQDTTEENLGNRMLNYRQEVLAPARTAGRVVLLYEPVDFTVEDRAAWTYNPGQRRVRRAPNFGFDNPATGSDGLATVDQKNMFSGSFERYNWKLVGKREMVVPYNSYRLNSPDTKNDDLIKPLHLNPDYIRYEVHRVWVVEAELKEKYDHLMPKRRWYIDEDSWNCVSADMYDKRGDMWRVSEGHVMTFYDVPVTMVNVEVHYDLKLGRYLMLSMTNEGEILDFTVDLDPEDFTTSALRRAGKR